MCKDPKIIGMFNASPSGNRNKSVFFVDVMGQRQVCFNRIVVFVMVQACICSTAATTMATNGEKEDAAGDIGGLEIQRF